MAEPRATAPDPEDTLGGEDFIFGEEAKEPGTQALERADLIARLTALMQSCDGCDHVRVLEVARLDKPDAGCNWSTTLVLDPGGVAPEVYALAYAQVIVAARKGWNLQ